MTKRHLGRITKSYFRRIHYMEDLNIVTAIGHLSTVQYRFEEAFPRLEMPCDSVEVEASSADDCGFVGHRQLVRRRFVAFPLT